MRTFELRVYKLRTKRRSILTARRFIPVISTAFRCSGLRPTASGPPRRMSSHDSSCWPLMRRAKIPTRSFGGTCKAQNSLTTSETLTFPTSLALNQRFSYLQQVLRSNDGEKGKANEPDNKLG